MPTFKHPCPHCGKYIARDVALCPFCGTSDPFAPGRCPNCSALIEDPAWAACPKCGQALVSSTVGKPASAEPAVPPPSAATEGRKCTGCGAPLAQDARFCTVCGTLAT